MPNSDGRFASGSTFGHYLLLEHLGADQLGVSWTAQQTAMGSPVILQFLHPWIAGDPQRLELIEAEAQQARALHHPAIARVYGVDSSEGQHFIVSEFVEGKSLAEELRDVAIESVPLAHIAIAIVQALDHAHSKGVIHGNLHARHILVAEDGRVKILGFGAGKGCGASGRMTFAGRDLETVSYLCPERIAGLGLDPRSDVFSFGVLLYEMATGSKPFHAETAEKTAERILHSPPAAPHLINPAISRQIVGIIGRCIQKDPSRRYPSAHDLLADLENLASELGTETEVEMPSMSPLPAAQTPVAAAETLTGPTVREAEIETVAGRTAARKPEDFPRERAIVYVTLPESHEEGKPAAGALAGRMHEIVDETVYLADGKILDPFAEQVIAEFANVFDAVRAARKCLYDLALYNSRQTGRAPTLDARLVVIQGDLETVEGSVRGPAVEMARVASRAIDPLKLAVAADIVHEISAQPAGGPLVTVAGRTFFELTSSPVLAAGISPPSAPPQPEMAAPALVPAGIPRHMKFIGAGLAALLVAGVATGIVFMRRTSAAEAEAVRRTELEQAVQPVVASGPTTIAFEALSVPAEIDPSAVSRANLARFGAIGMLRSLSELDVMTRAGGNAPRFTAEIRQGASGLEIVPVRLTPAAKQGPPIPLDAVASVPLANWIAEEMAINRPFERRDPSNLERFASAVAALIDREEPPPSQTVTLVRTVLQSDPQFAAAQMLAIDVFERSGDRKSAIEAATKVVSLDPEHLAVRRRLARWLFQSGYAVGAATHFAEILARNENDADAITAAGVYALAVGDEEKFRKALARLERTPGKVLHAPDLMLAAAQIDQAASPYFDLEQSEPNNAALALKIGRIAVLRHMNSIAEIELEKLEKLDPSYGLPMLRAYVYAQQGKRAEAEAELARAQRTAPWYAQPFTNSAEVYAILGIPGKVIESLESAIARGEPTGSYVRSNPLFRYLKGEARFRKLNERIDGEQAEIAQALALLTL